MNAEKAQAMGIDAFCLKPLLIHDLALTIQRVLDKRLTQLHNDCMEVPL